MSRYGGYYPGAELLDESLICSLGDHALLIKNAKEAIWLFLNQVQDSLVILELHVSPLNLFLGIFLLLHLEDVAVEELLDLLVGIIDAELLETVLLKVLKSKDIQQANEAISIGILYNDQF